MKVNRNIINILFKTLLKAFQSLSPEDTEGIADTSTKASMCQRRMNCFPMLVDCHCRASAWIQCLKKLSMPEIVI